ncbi:F-box/RNI-like superfamily protein [Rhynchospora pubera]|uniref:F-box/RNI-like superfamily protein n=1 Tax=Rhynchospora pubera TaxID=906938 RepID=A0AAV8FZU8_9POAL|nr:F-box/RNI-like superfamily protein [Rhynchospora pubera]
MAAVDRISALPEEIKVSILSLLSITDAVRTSVLSRSWCRLWTFLPGLHIDRVFLNNLRLLKGPDVDLESRIPRWAGIIERLLSSLCGPIHYFTLPNYSRIDSSHVNRFLALIFQKGSLEKLSISNAGLFQFPCFGSLKYLHLNLVLTSLPTNFEGLDQLTSLKLDSVFISQRDINLLVNSSKKLTSFHGADLRSLNKDEKLLVTFNCPLLKSIHFQFERFKAAVDARVDFAPCLESVYVGIKNNVKELALLTEPVMEFMADIDHVCYLYLDPLVFECLSELDVVNAPHTFPIHFHQLRCLKLDVQGICTDITKTEMFCHLLRSMPCLDQLQIKDYDLVKGVMFIDPISPNKYMKKQDGFHCLDKTLTRVEIYVKKLDDLNHIMWMMYLFLLNAKVLEVLKISFSKGGPKVTSRITKKLCAVKKASLDAKVVFVAGDIGLES